jgi:hypothetical protein
MNSSRPKVLVAVLIACSLTTSPAVGPQREGGNGTVAGDAPESAGIEQAVEAVIGASPPAGTRELFTRHLRRRGDAVAVSDKPKYWQELKAKSELARATIYGADSPQSRAVLKIIRPALTLYGREWDVAVVEQDAPAVGVFRQCILMVSTGLLRLVSDEELLCFAAHELAHECFIEELREADRLASTSAYHLVELKSDLVAALAGLLMKRDPLATVTGVARIEGYYRKSDPAVLRGGTHPEAALRRRCIELFLTKINLARAALRNGR